MARLYPKVKFFFWIALHGKLWTVERRHRHGLQHDAACCLCDQHDETSDHLLASCIFTREVWHRLLANAAATHLGPAGDARLADWWLRCREAVPGDLHRGFNSMVLLVS